MHRTNNTKRIRYSIRLPGTYAMGLAKKPANFGAYIEDVCRFNDIPLRNATLVDTYTDKVVATYRAPSFVVDA